MEKRLRIVKLIVVSMLAVALLVSCSGNKILSSTDENFKYSYGIDSDGFWDGIKATKNVTLCEYEGIQIPSDIHNITDEAVQSEVDGILASFTERIEITEGVLENGDTVNIDYVGSIDGVEFAGGSTQGAGADVTIGVTQYIDDFLEQLIGHSPGEEFDIEVTFPDEYQNEDLEGKDAVFAITINYIVGEEEPELTDEFVAENLAPSYGWTTVSIMRESIAGDLRDTAVENFIREYIIDNSTIDTLPEIIMEYQEFSMIQYYRDYANYYGMEFEDFITAYAGAATAEQLVEINIDQNTMTANLYLIIQAIAEDAGISVSDGEARDFFAQASQDGSYLQYESSYGLPHMKLVTLQRSVLEHLVEKAILQ